MAKEHIGMTVVPEFLRAAAGIYEERNKLYKDNYKKIGKVFMVMFPEGLELKTVDDFNRFFVFLQVVGKVMRYAEMFTAGGHEDSLDDNSVYSMMLKELDREHQSRKECNEALNELVREKQKRVIEKGQPFSIGDTVVHVGFLGHRYDVVIQSFTADGKARIVHVGDPDCHGKIVDVNTLKRK